MLITFVVFGKYLESAAKARTSNSLTSLMSLKVEQATLLRPKVQGATTPTSTSSAEQAVEIEEVQIDPKLLQPGDIVKVQTGQAIPGDGVVHSGSSCVDESMITGESLPVWKRAGDSVFAATINRTAPLAIRITTTGGDTALSQIIKLIQDAQGAKAPIQE